MHSSVQRQFGPRQEQREQPLVSASQTARSVAFANRWHQHRCISGNQAKALPAQHKTNGIGTRASWSLSQNSAGMCSRERALAKARSDTSRTNKPSAQKLPKNESSMDCYEDEHMNSSEATSAGRGSRRVRLKALGKSGWRARCAKSSEARVPDRSSKSCWIDSQC